jgi:transposase
MARPYSLDLRERVVAAGASCRKVAAWRRIGDLLGAFTSQECANYFRNAGYASI